MLNDRLSDQLEDNERNVKRQRRLQPASDPFNEQIGVFMSSTSSKYVRYTLMFLSSSYKKLSSPDDNRKYNLLVLILRMFLYRIQGKIHWMMILFLKIRICKTMVISAWIENILEKREEGFLLWKLISLRMKLLR